MLVLTPEEVFAGMISAFNRGSWLFAAGMACVLRNGFETGHPGLPIKEWAARIPTIVEVERVARENLAAEIRTDTEPALALTRS